MSKNKQVFVINGAGGVGKDTLIEKYLELSKVEIDVARNVSAVDVIKEIATKGGWKGEKDIKSRKLLSDLKKLFVDYNNLPTKDLVDKYNQFLSYDTQKSIMFVHIREPEEIQKFLDEIDHNAITLLVRRKGISDQHYGNLSDDRVEEFDYDVIFDNDKGLEESAKDFKELIDGFFR